MLRGRIMPICAASEATRTCLNRATQDGGLAQETPAPGRPPGSLPLVLTALQELLLKIQRPPTGRRDDRETPAPVRRPPAPPPPPADTPVRRSRGTPVETAPLSAAPPLRGQS